MVLTVLHALEASLSISVHVQLGLPCCVCLWILCHLCDSPMERAKDITVALPKDA